MANSKKPENTEGLENDLNRLFIVYPDSYSEVSEVWQKTIKRFQSNEAKSKTRKGIQFESTDPDETTVEIIDLNNFIYKSKFPSGNRPDPEPISEEMSVFLTQEEKLRLRSLLSLVKLKETEAKAKTERQRFQFVLFLVGLTYPPDIREDMLGHLSERYYKDKEKVGAAYAKLWIARDVGMSLVPVICEFMKTKTARFLKRIGLEIVWKYFSG